MTSININLNGLPIDEPDDDGQNQSFDDLGQAPAPSIIMPLIPTGTSSGIDDELNAVVKSLTDSLDKFSDSLHSAEQEWDALLKAGRTPIEAQVIEPNEAFGQSELGQLLQIVTDNESDQIGDTLLSRESMIEAEKNAAREPIDDQKFFTALADVIRSEKTTSEDFSDQIRRDALFSKYSQQASDVDFETDVLSFEESPLGRALKLDQLKQEIGGVDESRFERRLKLEQYKQEIASSAEEKPDVDPIHVGKYEFIPGGGDAEDVPGIPTGGGLNIPTGGGEGEVPDMPVPPGEGGDAEVPDIPISPGEGGGKVPPGDGPSIAAPSDDDGVGPKGFWELFKQVGGRTGAGRLGSALGIAGEGAGISAGIASGVASAGGALALYGITKQFKDMASGVITGGIEARGDISARIYGGITSAEPTGPAQALEGARGTFEDVSKIVDPLGLNITLDIMNAQFKALTATVSAVDEGLKSLANDLRGISPELVGASVDVEMMRLEGRLRQNESIGQELADVEVSKVRFEEDVRILKTKFLAVLLPTIQEILDLLRLFMPILQGIATVATWVMAAGKKAVMNFPTTVTTLLKMLGLLSDIRDLVDDKIGGAMTDKVIEDLEKFRGLGEDVPSVRDGSAPESSRIPEMSSHRRGWGA